MLFSGVLLTLLLRTVAAVAIVAAMGVAGTLYFSHDSEQIYATPVGGHQLIALADRSTVELNTDTVLHARGRSVELVKGEAYSRIKHDAAHPFVGARVAIASPISAQRSLCATI